MARLIGTNASGGSIPGAPTIGTATAGDATATVTFTVPSYLGKNPAGATYVATSSPGGVTGATSSGTSVDINGLTNGTEYTFTVAVNTGYGVVGPASSPSNAVTPASLSRGVMAGGQFTSRMSYINFASAGNDTYFGDLSVSRLGPGGFGSSTRGVIGNGSSG